MTNLFITILSFLVTVGVLVVIHELGHYLVARAVGVKILRFSVGFGRPLWSRRLGRDGTEWVLAAVPLGGYVKMLDEREDPVPAGEAHRAFNRKPVWARILVVLAGPAANFLLAFLIYWGLFIAGTQEFRPVLREAPSGTVAAAAGIRSGDTVRSVGEEPVQTWTDVRWLLLQEAVKRANVAVEIEAKGGARSTRNLDLSSLTVEDLDQDFLAKLGLRPLQPNVPAVMGKVHAGMAGARAGVREGDRIVSIGAKPIAGWQDFITEIRASPGRAVDMEVERGAERVTLRIVPDTVGEGPSRAGRLGVEAPPELKRAFEALMTTVRYGPVDAASRALRKVWDLSTFSLKMLGRMIMGDVSLKNLSGPITIADYAGQTAQLGWVVYLGFLALVSVSLGVLNLLPIPMLDGGHLVYYLAEIAKGTPVSERTMEIGQRIGLTLLLGLTIFAFYNDINRLVSG